MCLFKNEAKPRDCQAKTKEKNLDGTDRKTGAGNTSCHLGFANYVSQAFP
jgi:hypothetical protein